MSEYHQLLDATVRHLEELRASGERFVSVERETLNALVRPAPRAAVRPAAAPAARPAMSTPPAPANLRPPSPATTMAPPKTSAPEAKPATGNREAAIAALREQVLACVKCPNLVKARQKVVFGVGTIYADLMFVGEAPGADEDAQGEPFVGAAGQLLTKIILAMGLSREQVFIGNILKCRPDTPGQSSGNRKPMPEEMQTCLPWLMRQIEIIQPKVLVALGATAVEGLLGKTVGITKLRGNWQSFRGIPLMPTYHPAYLLRNQSLSVKREVWEDMLKAMEKLGMPISAKQRNFFLSK